MTTGDRRSQNGTGICEGSTSVQPGADRGLNEIYLVLMGCVLRKSESPMLETSLIEWRWGGAEAASEMKKAEEKQLQRARKVSFKRDLKPPRGGLQNDNSKSAV
jgi:hypothetical protein